MHSRSNGGWGGWIIAGGFIGVLRILSVPDGFVGADDKDVKLPCSLGAHGGSCGGGELSAEGCPGGPDAVAVGAVPEGVVGAAGKDVYSSVGP